MVEAPPETASCQRCGGTGTSAGTKQGRRPGDRRRRRKVCVPCGTKLGVVWTEFQADTPAGPGVVRVQAEPRP